MKKNIKAYLAVGLMAVSAVGCTDLKTDIESQYIEYPTNEIAVEAKMSDIYFQTRSVYGRRGFEALGLSSDEFTSAAYGGGWYDNGAYAHPSFHTFVQEDATLDWYGVLTGGIAKANQIIDELGGDQAEPDVVAPAKVMRAYFHWIIMDGWGDTPKLDHSLTDGELVDRSPRAEITRWIADELEAAIPYLTEDVTENTYGKPTKWMAKALLAKIYLNWAVYTASSVDQYDAATAQNEKLGNVISLCDDIINSGKFSLDGGVSSWQAKFGPDNDYKVKDFVYALPWGHIEGSGMQWGRAMTWKDAKNCAVSYYGCKLNQSAGAYMVMTPEMTDLFYDDNNVARPEAGDRAKSVICGPAYVYDQKTYLPTDEPALDKNGKQIVLSKQIALRPNDNGFTDPEKIEIGNDIEAFSQGARTVKFFIKESDYSDSRNQSNDTPIFRFADILLMKAEAIVRQGGNNATALDLFNQIRSYVNATTHTGTLTLDDIYDERGREFLGEGWRRNDMIRFGHYEDEWFPHYKTGEFAPFASFDKTKRIWPLHRDILNTNANWKQNPGY